MPDQPPDAIHYEMKIPPAKKEGEQGRERGSDEVAAESNAGREKQGSGEKPASEIPSE